MVSQDMGEKRMSVRLNTSFVGEAADAAKLSAIHVLFAQVSANILPIVTNR